MRPLVAGTCKARCGGDGAEGPCHKLTFNHLQLRLMQAQNAMNSYARYAQVWDLRKAEVAMTLKGHANTVTGLRVSPDGTHLLSNAMVRSA